MVYQPTSRVLTALELLESRPGISGAELAERLEVDRRTVRRYITTLQDLGVPVHGVRGRHGGYRLQPGFRLPPLMLTDDEALAVSLGLLLSQRLGISIDPGSTESASAKLARVLPIPLGEQARAVRDVVSLAQPEAEFEVDRELLGRLSRAAGKRQRVHLHYRTWQQNESQRDVDPYGLVYLVQRWYLIGYCRMREDLRMFRLDRIEHCRILDATFEPPEEFDCLEYATNALATMPGYWSVKVRLDLPPAAARDRVPATYGTLTADGNRTIFCCTTDNLDGIARQLVALSCRFTVIEPDELRDWLRYLASRIETMAVKTNEG